MQWEQSFVVLLGLLGVAVSQTRNVFMALMYAVMLYVNASIVLLGLGFEFMALVNMLVYVGALAVLFLFIIMLLEIPSTELRGYFRGSSALSMGAMVAAHGVKGERMSEAHMVDWTPTLESLSQVGYAFYIRYADILVLNSLVLTIALLGALVLAHASQN